MIGKKLANLLVAFRVAVADNPTLIENPTQSTVDAAQIRILGIQKYQKYTGEELDSGDEITQRLLLTVSEVIRDAKAGKFKDLWIKTKSGTPAPFAGKFLPARFAAQVASRFSEKSEGQIVMRLTTEPGKLVNSDNAPDHWEQQGLLKYINGGKKSWETLSEKTTYRGKPATRIMKVELYGSSCLKCHGEDGAKLHPDGSKGTLNNIGGAVSVVMF
ncbi:MAG: DUF3365 domain-containing protein [Bdellovibrionota bacterium]